MNRNAAQREFKKLKNQVSQIQEIAHNSKGGALLENESTIRKKLLSLQEIEKEGFKEYNQVVEGYQSILEEVDKKLIEDYNKKNDTDFDYYEVVRGKYISLVNSGIMAVLINQHIPKLIKQEFNDNFPDNPKDEYRETRGIKRKFIIHLGDTNTGKTYNAMQILKKCKKGIYLSPLRILALENYERLNNEGVVCDLLTGEEEIIHENSTHTSCTIEKLNLKKQYEIAVIDEIQMINDSQRGAAWSRALLGVRAKEIHVCGAMNAKDILIKILEDCGEQIEFKEYKRRIPLEVEDNDFTNSSIKAGDAIVVFSKKRVLEIATNYANNGIKASVLYGDLPPEVRKNQYEQFISKVNSILVATDAIGMGVNLPIRRIIFLNTRKFDGDEVRDLTSQEVKQIAGRAGRIGIYDIGYVASRGPGIKFIKEKLKEEDQTITQAVIGPTEAILRIKTLPLIQKLSLWSTRKEKLEYYRKMDISDYLIILERIKSYKLNEKIQWKLIKVPFDVNDEELMEQFIFYVDELFVMKSKTISVPILTSGTLDELELYYKKVNIYYSFCKIFNLDFDMQWVYDERAKVSQLINEILVTI